MTSKSEQLQIHKQIADRYRITESDIPTERLLDGVYAGKREYFQTGEKMGTEMQAIPIFANFGPNPEGSTIIRFMAITDEPGRPENAFYRQTLADMTDAQAVLDIGNPGVEFSSYRRDMPKKNWINKLSERQRRELLRVGSFSDLGIGTSKAITDALEKFNLRGDVVLLGPSLGSSVAVGAITPLFEEGVDIESVIGIDPVGWTSRRHPLVRGKQFLDSGNFADPYLAANHPEHQRATEDFNNWLKRTLGSASANAVFARAASMGGGAGDILDVELNTRNHLVMGPNRDGNGSEVIMVVPGGSEFGTGEELAQLNHLMGRLGIYSTLVEVQDASHAIAMSVGAVAAVVTRLPQHPGAFGAKDNSRVFDDLPAL